MKQYKVVLFDLDHTLWDFDRNSLETLTELYDQNELQRLGFTFDEFHSAFQAVNTKLWDLYDRGLLDRSVIRYQRFKMIFESIQIQNDEIAARLSAGYISLSPTKSNLVEGALELLDYLKNRYPLYVITNGFTEMQTTKARSGGIENYFQSIVTSEMAGYKKPAKEIFDFVLSRSGFNHHEAIMIGDNLLTDIAGAFQAGIDTVHFLPQHRLTPEGGMPNGQEESQITHQISKLIDLKEIL